MGTFFGVLFGTIFGVAAFLGIGGYLLYLRFKRSFGITGSQLKNMIKESEDSKYRHKSISGMSNVLVPKILRDYSSFNETELYNKVESSLRSVYVSLEKQKVSDNKELTLIKNNLEEQIQDLINSDTKVEYHDVKFHKHALRSYNNEDGYLCIEVESSLEYYYKKYVNGKLKKGEDYKTQNVVNTKFIHIYDPIKFEDNKSHLSAHCPNCGAPLKNFKDNYCPYCSSGVEPINLKSWYLSSYKEKY